MSAAPVESEHLLAAQTFAQGMPSDEDVQLSNQVDVPSELEVGFDSLLTACELLLDETCPFMFCERLLELCKGRPPPELQRFSEGCGGRLRVAGRGCFAAFRVQGVKGVQVERVAVEHAAVARSARLNESGRQLLPQLGHEDLHHLPGALRYLVAPEVVHDP